MRKLEDAVAGGIEGETRAALAVAAEVDRLRAGLFGVHVDFFEFVAAEFPSDGRTRARGEQDAFAVGFERFEVGDVEGAHGATFLAHRRVLRARVFHFFEEWLAGFVERDAVDDVVPVGIEAAVAREEVEDVVVELDGLEIEQRVRIDARDLIGEEERGGRGASVVIDVGDVDAFLGGLRRGARDVDDVEFFVFGGVDGSARIIRVWEADGLQRRECLGVFVWIEDESDAAVGIAADGDNRLVGTGDHGAQNAAIEPFAVDVFRGDGWAQFVGDVDKCALFARCIGVVIVFGNRFREVDAADHVAADGSGFARRGDEE